MNKDIINFLNNIDFENSVMVYETVVNLLEEKQELIDYLKEKKKEYKELYNKSCDIIDFDRYESLNILCEKILSKIEKRVISGEL